MYVLVDRTFFCRECELVWRRFLYANRSRSTSECSHTVVMALDHRDIGCDETALTLDGRFACSICHIKAGP